MLKENIIRFKKKYYLNDLLKGSITAGAVLLSSFYFVNILEYLGNFDSLTRGILFYLFVISSLYALYRWVFTPLFYFFQEKSQFSDIEAAKRIGELFPDVKDKLVNTLQLQQLKSESGNSDLIAASIAQREQLVGNIEFTRAIDFGENKKYAHYLVIPLIAIAITLLLAPQLFTETTPRLINYDKKYEPKAPFSFIVANDQLSAFKNDDFELKLKFEGSAIPQTAQIITADGRKIKMSAAGNGEFSYIFKKLQNKVNFRFESSGFYSDGYQIQVFTRPSLKSFNVNLEYPAYIKKRNERLENTGNLIIPEGTNIKWLFSTLETDGLSLLFDTDSNTINVPVNKQNTFEYNKVARKSETYQVLLSNPYSTNKDIIEYFLNVIPDEYPTVSLNKYEDTVLYDYLIIGGNIGDDHGVTALNMKYRIINDSLGRDPIFKTQRLNFNPELINQSYFYNLKLADLQLRQGDRLEYYVEVWDNDGVNGRKSTKTNLYSFSLPSRDEFKKELAKNTESTESQMEETLSKAKEINQELKELQDKLKGKRKLDWNEKQTMQKLIEKNEKLKEEIKKLQDMNQMLNQKQDKFKTNNEEIAKKAEQLQKLMDELLDEETKRLYEQLQQLMEQNFINQDMQQVLDKIQLKEKDIEKELERALELFKKLKFDKKAEEIAKDLEELAKQQKDLAEETAESKKEKLDEMQQKQEALNKKFEEVKESLEELEEINNSMQNQKDLQNFDQQQKQIGKEQENTKENLEQKNQKKASESQKKMSEKMKEMAEQMRQMQQSMEMQEMAENYDDLRKILENLIKISFDQEDLMLEFQKIKRIDPKYVKLSQQQLKIRDDAKIIEDSLVSLSKRVFQIESFVTREVSEMNLQMDESMDAIRKRTPEIAASRQQFAMTSMNNLALLLNDILKQMQQQMSQAMSGKQMSEKKGGSPKLSDLQKQLNNRIEELKKSGKTGRELSEELAKLAAEQEMIRNALKQGMDKGKGQKGEKEGQGSMDGNNGDGGDGYKELLDKMEKTEEDLVNKKITQETLERQKEIMTRLLESEKAQRERELDEQRESRTAEQRKNQNTPNEFNEYLKVKEMQIELLKTIPTSLNPYYKKQVNEYFKRIKN
jgi:hypothetical protein